jgi:tetratricopeptide (TPR) repeat protein
LLPFVLCWLLEIGHKVYTPSHPDVAIRLNNLGLILRDLGDLQGARKNFESALEIDLKVYGPDLPKTRAVEGILEVLEAAAKFR